MSLFPLLPVLLLSMVAASFSETETCEDVWKTCPGTACSCPGADGFPGKDGCNGTKGEKGEPATLGRSSSDSYLLEETVWRCEEGTILFR